MSERVDTWEKILTDVRNDGLWDLADRLAAFHKQEVEERKSGPDYIVSLPDLTGKTVPARTFRRIAEAADPLVMNGWKSLSTDGFVMVRGNGVVRVREEQEVLPKAAVMEKLKRFEGCGEDTGPWGIGFQKAIETVCEAIGEMEGGLL